MMLESAMIASLQNRRRCSPRIAEGPQANYPKKENGIGKSRENPCGIKDYIPMGCHLRSSSLSDGNLMKIKALEMKRRFHFPF